MAIKINWREERNATIVKKVESILKNAEFDSHLTIVIEAYPGTRPSIRYNIMEDIVPEEQKALPKLHYDRGYNEGYEKGKNDNEQM